MVKKKNEAGPRLQAKDIDTVAVLRVFAESLDAHGMGWRGAFNAYCKGLGYPQKLWDSKWVALLRAGLITGGCPCGCYSSCTELTAKGRALLEQKVEHA